jgi:hypothetical protein
MKNRQIWLTPCLPVFFKRALFHGKSVFARSVVIVYILRYVSQRIQLACDQIIARLPSPVVVPELPEPSKARQEIVSRTTEIDLDTGSIRSYDDVRK